jgi:Tol biopolymer transport system component
MKTLGLSLVALLLAAGLWALALGDPHSRDAGSASAASASEVWASTGPVHPGADSLETRRVLAEADGLHTPLPDGSGIVFSDGDGNVAIRDLRTDEVRTLTDDGRLQEGGAFAYGFAVSPGGDRIAYVWAGGSQASLRVVDAVTGQVRELVPEGDLRWVSVDPGSWAPDGEALAAVLYFEDGSQRIALVPVDGRNPTFLRSFDWREPTRLAFSPDGEWLAYDLRREANSPVRDIRLLARDGSEEVPLLEGTTNQRVVGWMPGGGRFHYLVGDPAQSTLMAAKVESGRIVDGPWQVRADLRDPWPRGFSQDAFFYVQMPERAQAHTAPFDAAAGELAGPLRPLDPGRATGWPLNMAWSPDGDRVAYIVRAHGEDNALVVRSLSTGAERTMRVPFNEQFTRIEWSPTEDRLAVAGTDDRSRSGVHLLDLSDGSVEVFLRTDRDLVRYGHPRWSPGGDRLYAIRQSLPESSWAVVRADLSGGEEEVIFDGAGLDPVEGIAVSPDETQVAVAYGAGRAAWLEEAQESTEFRVLLVALADDLGEPRELMRAEAPGGAPAGAAADLDWTPDGQHLVIGMPWRTLWVADRNGIEVRKLEGAVGTRPRVRPNGRELSVIAGENRWEIWALVGLGAPRAEDAADRAPER